MGSSTASASLLAASLAVVAVLVSFLVFDLGQISSPSSAPSAPVTPPPAPALPPSFVNNTFLSQFCVAQCGAGGRCNQSATTGIIDNCITCGNPAATIDKESGACVVLGDCTLWPWCSSVEAQALTQAHRALVALTQTDNTTVAFPRAHPSVPGYVPLMGSSVGVIGDRIDSYVAAKFALVAQNNSINVPFFFDDEDSQWGGEQLLVYRDLLPALYEPYVTGVKRSACTRRWAAIDGKCRVVLP